MAGSDPNSDLLVAQPSSLSQGGGGNDADVAETVEIVDQLRRDFIDRDKLHQTIEAILFNEVRVEIPDAYKKTALEVHVPFPLHIVNSVTAALSINAPSVSFQPVGFGTSYQENSTLREHFFQASWERQQEEAKRRLFRLFMFSLVAKGEAILKTVERSKTAWSDYSKSAKKLQKDLDAPDGPYQDLDQAGKDDVYNRRTEEMKRGAPYPIKTTYVRPDNFYYLKGEDGFTYCCEVKQVPYYDTLAHYKVGLDDKGRVVPEAMGLPMSNWGQVMGKRRNLVMVEAWDWQFVSYILIGPGQQQSDTAVKLGKGSLVRKLRHGYGDAATHTLRGPYFHAFATTTDVNAPDRAGLGVLYPFLDLFPLLNSLVTIRGNAAYMTGFPAFKQVQAPGASLPPAAFGNDGTEEDGAGSQNATVTPGAIYPYDIAPIAMPAAGPEFAQFLNDVKQMIDLALPQNVQGVVEGDQSGYALNQAVHLARLLWDPIVDNAEIALGERTSFESWLIENRVRERVYVYGETPPRRASRQLKAGWLGVGPDELQGVHRYKVVLNPETPSSKIIDIRMHQELLNMRLEAPEDAITELGNNPDEVERAWLLHDLKADPQIHAQLVQRAFKQLATIDQKSLGGQQAIAGATAPAQQPNTGLGGSASSIGQVFQPGQNGMPLAPTQAGPAAGPGPGPTAGMPGGIPNPPQNALPLPGQQGQ